MYMEANVIFCLLFRRPSNNGFSVVIRFCIHDKRVSVGLNKRFATTTEAEIEEKRLKLNLVQSCLCMYSQISKQNNCYTCPYIILNNYITI